MWAQTTRRVASRPPYGLVGVLGLHTRSSFRLTPIPRRWASLQAGEQKSGHINAGPNEGIVFFCNVFPLKLQWLLRLPWQSENAVQKVLERADSPMSSVDPGKLLQNLNSDTKGSFKVLEILPRLKEGGAFVKFSHDATSNPEAVQQSLEEFLKTKRIRPWWSPMQRIRASLVRGVPWVEDMRRLPSQRLKVEFIPSNPGGEAAELSQEQLYSLFRPYGRLAEITSQPSDSKVQPKFATIDFNKINRAVMAKNCLHGLQLSDSDFGKLAGTMLRLTYERKAKSRWFRDWFFGHPRIVIPALAAIFAALIVAIFDPVRTFFVKAHVSRAFKFSDNRFYRWLVTKADDILPFGPKLDDDMSMDAIWDDRKGNVEQIERWLSESDDTFIIIQGPRGSGKEELVIDQALRNWRNKLVIDCKPIIEARGDNKTIRAMANQVGYRPVLSWLNSLSGMVDLAAQGAAGVKTGFSETVDTQLQKIMTTTAAALRQTALQGRRKEDQDANLTDDEYLEAHPEKRPVVVINNFLHKGQETSIVYDKLAEWAARITTADVAHVIFLTKDVSFSKSLTKALPDRVFHQISLSDCSTEVARQFVLSHLPPKPKSEVGAGPEKEVSLDGAKHTWPFKPTKAADVSDAVPTQEDLPDLDSCIAQLGGRLTDLEFFARRVQSGESTKQAIEEIIAQSASEIQKLYLYEAEGPGSRSASSASGSNDRLWSAEQAWHLIRRFAQATAADPTGPATLRYNEILQDDAFAKTGDGNDYVLHALEQAELITIISTNGRPSAIKAGRPIFLPAFTRLVDDAVLNARMEIAIFGRLIAAQNKTIEKCEGELKLLGELPVRPAELQSRSRWLLGKVMKAQAKVEAYEAESDKLAAVLVKEY